MNDFSLGIPTDTSIPAATPVAPATNVFTQPGSAPANPAANAPVGMGMVMSMSRIGFRAETPTVKTILDHLVLEWTNFLPTLGGEISAAKWSWHIHSDVPGTTTPGWCSVLAITMTCGTAAHVALVALADSAGSRMDARPIVKVPLGAGFVERQRGDQELVDNEWTRAFVTAFTAANKHLPGLDILPPSTLPRGLSEDAQKVFFAKTFQAVAYRALSVQGRQDAFPNAALMPNVKVEMEAGRDVALGADGIPILSHLRATVSTGDSASSPNSAVSLHGVGQNARVVMRAFAAIDHLPADINPGRAKPQGLLQVLALRRIDTDLPATPGAVMLGVISLLGARHTHSIAGAMQRLQSINPAAAERFDMGGLNLFVGEEGWGPDENRVLSHQQTPFGMVHSTQNWTQQELLAYYKRIVMDNVGVALDIRLGGQEALAYGDFITLITSQSPEAVTAARSRILSAIDVLTNGKFLQELAKKSKDEQAAINTIFMPGMLWFTPVMSANDNMLGSTDPVAEMWNFVSVCNLSAAEAHATGDISKAPLLKDYCQLLVSPDISSSGAVARTVAVVADWAAHVTRAQCNLHGMAVRAMLQPALVQLLVECVDQRFINATVPFGLQQTASMTSMGIMAGVGQIRGGGSVFTNASAQTTANVGLFY